MGGKEKDEGAGEEEVSIFFSRNKNGKLQRLASKKSLGPKATPANRPVAVPAASAAHTTTANKGFVQSRCCSHTVAESRAPTWHGHRHVSKVLRLAKFSRLTFRMKFSCSSAAALSTMLSTIPTAQSSLSKSSPKPGPKSGCSSSAIFANPHGCCCNVAVPLAFACQQLPVTFSLDKDWRR